MRPFPTTAPSSRLQTARKPCLKAAYHTNSFYSPLANVAERSSRTWLPGDKLRKVLMGGYSPTIRTVDLGKEAEYMTSLEPRQRICYYPGKLHGGIQAFYLDNLFADCCRGALTANLTLSYLRPVNPRDPLSFSVWPVKVEGRKTYMEGCIKTPDAKTGAMIEAVRAKAVLLNQEIGALEAASFQEPCHTTALFPCDQYERRSCVVHYFCGGDLWLGLW